MSFFRFHEISQKAYSEVLPLFNSPEFFFSWGGNREYYLQEEFLGLVLTENEIDSLLCMLLEK